MEVNGSKKLMVASAVGGAALFAGALFAGSTFVSAQEQSPTPGVEQQQTPDDQQTPRDDGTTPKSREDCEKDGNGASGRGFNDGNSRYL